MSNQPYPPDPRDPREQNYAPQQGQPYGVVQDSNRSTEAGGVYDQRQSEHYVDPAGNQVERHEEVFEDKNQSRANIRYWITTITYFLLGVLEIVLLLRLVFRLLGASQYNSFIVFLYNLSHIFVAPFNGIFNDQALGNNVFEVSTVVAMLVYALIAWGIVSLGRVAFAPNIPGRQSVITTRRSR